MSTSVTMASSSDCRSQRVESSSASRALRRQERGGSSVRAHAVAYPVGKETGLPLIQCPDCHLARVIELRIKQDTPTRVGAFSSALGMGSVLLCLHLSCFLCLKSRV